MDVVDLPLAQIFPYARNPRRNAQAIATVAASIQEFGWRHPSSWTRRRLCWPVTRGWKQAQFWVKINTKKLVPISPSTPILAPWR